MNSKLRQRIISIALTASMVGGVGASVPAITAVANTAVTMADETTQKSDAYYLSLFKTLYGDGRDSTLYTNSVDSISKLTDMYILLAVTVV